MRRIFVMMLLVMTSFVVKAQTYYYERVSIIKNGQQYSASGDGHFITFTNDGRCFDSTNKGYNENYGIRHLTIRQNGITCYEGQSYWGRAKYLFSSDYSRLNIRLSTGEVYVYSRKTPPTGVTESKRAPRDVVNSAATTPAASGVSQTPSFGGGSSSSSGGSSSSSNQSRYGYYTCPSCYGSGRCPICHGKHIANNSYTGGSHICYSCNNKGDCSACGGKGKKYGIVR